MSAATMRAAIELAERLSDSYSTDRYHGGWLPCIKMLSARGYTEREVEAIIRSKWTRWAADASSERYGRANSADLARFMDGMGTKLAPRLAELVAESFEGTNA